MPDQASTPNPLPPTDAAPETPGAAGADSDSLVRAFGAVNRARAGDDDTPEIAADDEGATRLAEEIGAVSQAPAA